MSQRDAQKSEVHQTTDDADTSPASGPAGSQAASPPRNFERGAATAKVNPDADFEAEPPGRIGGGPGAGDASSGGGAGSGVPGGGTDMRTDGAIKPGNVDEDRRRLGLDSGTGGPDAGANKTKQHEGVNSPREGDAALGGTIDGGGEDR